MEGVVKWFNSRRGYGFIRGDDGVQYFAHYKFIETNDSFKTLSENERVKFDIEKNPRGIQAVNIKKELP